jgi:hypothetical protein
MTYMDMQVWKGDDPFFEDESVIGYGAGGVEMKCVFTLLLELTNQ